MMMMMMIGPDGWQTFVCIKALILTDERDDDRLTIIRTLIFFSRLGIPSLLPCHPN